MESEINTILFLIIVVLGALVQPLTGFAIGLIIMAGVALFNIAGIAFTAAVVSLISLANAGIALIYGHRHVDWLFVRGVLLGLIPVMALGIILLSNLSEHYYALLKLLLGLVIILARASLMVALVPFSVRSSSLMFTLFGAFGGLLAGLYSAGGARLAYFAYRQPISINTIRFSLLAVFVVSTAIRAAMIGVSGQLNMTVLQMSAVTIPLVIVVTLVAGCADSPRSSGAKISVPYINICGYISDHLEFTARFLVDGHLSAKY
ncbi:sulfite exporter TauE/SafE family protein [Gammaproteobacteria bacterium]|nr:sulfite exporter TauE/SafE family protein [Gammaproteobacteria bacterium]